MLKDGAARSRGAHTVFNGVNRIDLTGPPGDKNMAGQTSNIDKVIEQKTNFGGKMLWAFSRDSKTTNFGLILFTCAHMNQLNGNLKLGFFVDGYISGIHMGNIRDSRVISCFIPFDGYFHRFFLHNLTNQLSVGGHSLPVTL